MIDALIADMESWDNDSLLNWALATYRMDLECSEDNEIELKYQERIGDKT